MGENGGAVGELDLWFSSSPRETLDPAFGRLLSPGTDKAGIFGDETVAPRRQLRLVEKRSGYLEFFPEAE